MADTGWKFPGAAAGNRSGGDSWANPSNITADDTSFATVTLDNAFESSAGLAATDYDFSSIPDGATIDGIEVRIGDYSVDVTGGAPTWLNCRVIDELDADGGANSPTPGWSASEQTALAGGASSLWELTPSKTDVNDIDWGFFFQAWQTFGVTTVYSTDFMQMKIYYSIGPQITDVDTDETWDDGDTGLVITGTGFV